jgi:hypothetical protein
MYQWGLGNILTKSIFPTGKQKDIKPEKNLRSTSLRLSKAQIDILLFPIICMPKFKYTAKGSILLIKTENSILSRASHKHLCKR